MFKLDIYNYVRFLNTKLRDNFNMSMAPLIFKIKMTEYKGRLWGVLLTTPFNSTPFPRCLLVRFLLKMLSLKNSIVMVYNSDQFNECLDK